jgi:hypothetical protein
LGLSHFGFFATLVHQHKEVQSMAKGSAVKEALHEVAQAARINNEEVHEQTEQGNGWAIVAVLVGIGIAAYWWNRWRNR